ncbi:MAG: ATP-binding protein [Desulfuromonas sp.]|nr:ATP-binding protein [Desulfuromonas sp.]
MKTTPEHYPRYYPRFLNKRITEALDDTPVVLIAGPRQSGKTTLVLRIANQEMRYLTLDDEVTLLAAANDPVGFIRNLDRAVIDEIQRAPQLLLAIKKSIDEDRRPGRFLLTGSANLMTLPTVADSLAGRMETLKLFPLSQSELHHCSTNWLDFVFAGEPPTTSTPVVGDDLVEMVLRGGYPEAITRATLRRRAIWCQQYVDAIIQRDVLDIASIEKLDQLPRLLSALTQIAGQMCNYSKLGGQVGLDHKTAAKYIGIFEQMYLIRRVSVWSNNQLKRVVKTPKIQFIDSGLLSALAKITPDIVRQDRTRFGNILESFVFSELLKFTTIADDEYQILYYRDHDQYEVDFVIENFAGEIVGVELKGAATVKQNDLRGLKRLQNTAGDKFKLGIVLYDGTETLPLGDSLWAAPISTLWAE